jgi:hypothetical protein
VQIVGLLLVCKNGVAVFDFLLFQILESAAPAVCYHITILAPRYGLYALRGRSSATLVPLAPPLLLSLKRGEGTHSGQQQVFSVLCDSVTREVCSDWYRYFTIAASDCKCRLCQRVIDATARVTAKTRVECVFLLKLCLIFCICIGLHAVTMRRRKDPDEKPH